MSKQTIRSLRYSVDPGTKAVQICLAMKSMYTISRFPVMARNQIVLEDKQLFLYRSQPAPEPK